MSFLVKFSDVTKYEGDAVLNSLGIDGRVYGRLCSKIIKASKDESIKQFIDSKTDNTVGEIFLTSAGNLPCKNIIHVVTPFRKYDEDISLLKKTYKDVIDFAIKSGYKTLGLPFIGTGANGYSESEAYEAVTSACGDINLLEEKEDRDIIDITVIAYLKKKSLKRKHLDVYFEDELDEIVANKCVPITICNSLKVSKIIEYKQYLRKPNMAGEDLYDEEEEEKNIDEIENDLVFQISQTMGDMAYDEYFIPGIKYYRVPYDYVDDYIFKKGITDKVLADAALDRKRKFQMRKQKSLSKLDIYRLSHILNMNKTQTLEFMIICGVSFSPLSKLDVFYFNYLNGKYGEARSLYELQDMAKGRVEEEVYFPYSIPPEEDNKPKTTKTKTTKTKTTKTKTTKTKAKEN